jgi:hypothetical protein
MANLGDLGSIAVDGRFGQRVANALAVAAAAVYSETSFAATSQASAASSLTLTFAAVPSWVTPGGGVADLTNQTNTIKAGTIIVAVTATTVTLSQPIGSAGVASGDIISFTQHGARASFANRVSAGSYDLLHANYVVLANSTIANEAVWPGTADHSIADADIQFAVNSNWNLLAGA